MTTDAACACMPCAAHTWRSLAVSTVKLLLSYMGQKGPRALQIMLAQWALPAGCLCIYFRKAAP